MVAAAARGLPLEAAVAEAEAAGEVVADGGGQHSPGGYHEQSFLRTQPVSALWCESSHAMIATT